MVKEEREESTVQARVADVFWQCCLTAVTLALGALLLWLPELIPIERFSLWAAGMLLSAAGFVLLAVGLGRLLWLVAGPKIAIAILEWVRKPMTLRLKTVPAPIGVVGDRD